MIESKNQTLVALDETRSFSKAAKKLGISQPAVSQQVKAIEKELEITLFTKENGALKPTAEGAIAIKFARRFLSLYSQELTSIGNVRKEAFSLSVGLPVGSSSLLGETLARLASQTSGLKISIAYLDITSIYSKLESYEIDFAILESPYSGQKFKSILLDSDNLFLALSPHSLFAGKSIANLDDLKRLNLILESPGSGDRLLLEKALQGQNASSKDLSITLESDNLSLLKDLVAKDVGASILPWSLCKKEQADGRIALLPIEGLPLRKEITVLYPSDFDHPELLNGLVRAYQSLK